MMKLTKYNLLILVALFLVGCSNFDTNVQNGIKCKYSDGQYLVWEPGDCWRSIILPGTKLPLSVSVWDQEKQTFVHVGDNEGEEGHPTTLDDIYGLLVDEQAADEYIANVKVVMWHEVSDGNYCVFRVSPDWIDEEPPWCEPTWTVWTKELMQAVKERQELK